MQFAKLSNKMNDLSEKKYPYHDKLFGCRISVIFHNYQLTTLLTTEVQEQHQDIVNHTKFSVYTMYRI